MNCGLLRDQHEHSPHQRINIEVFHFVFWHAFELSSQIRVDSLKVWNVSTRYVAVVRSLRVVLVVDVQIFSGGCTILKSLILVHVDSSEFPHTFAQLCICESHLRAWRCVILI